MAEGTSTLLGIALIGRQNLVEEIVGMRGMGYIHFLGEIPSNVKSSGLEHVEDFRISTVACTRLETNCTNCTILLAIPSAASASMVVFQAPRQSLGGWRMDLQ